MILAGIIVYSYESAIQMLAMDWGNIETFYDFIYRILLVVIAVELIRTLVTHNLTAVLELIAFVVARPKDAQAGDHQHGHSSVRLCICSIACRVQVFPSISSV
ncbi:MAG: hypothetical protein U9R74_08235 [Pseudomonadota bacterium]|nr:hypothetical protein [Pseudomonadota bacterium]